MIRLSNIKLGVDEKDFKNAVSRKLKIDIQDIEQIQIFRKSIDARHGQVKFVYSFDVKISKNENKIVSKIKNAAYAPEKDKWSITPGTKLLSTRPIIIGAGPSGLFCSLLLSEYGYKPLILERGKKVEQRSRDIDNFFQEAKLDTESNICFGEGGAGTFSDGKLKTRISDPKCLFVLQALRDAGAPGDILYDASPHVGTDILKVVISNIRKRIEKNGGEFIFESKVDDIRAENGEVLSLLANGNWYESEAVVLAIGHSARDTYEMLLRRSVQMVSKPFAIGVRIEHPRITIDKAMYHQYAGNKNLGAASYSLSAKTKSGNSYTFCMCPGGVVVNSSTEEDSLCVNGMSWHKRDGENSNSAIVSQILPRDIEGDSPLKGIGLQRKYEKKAFELGGADYKVPACRVADFLDDAKPKAFEVKPTVMPGAVPANIKNALPKEVYHTIAQAIPEMGKRLKGFDMGGAVLSALESRTSSPVRILRGKDMQSVSVSGLYPIGEGAGYAGGIVSSAVDGLKAAESIISLYSIEGLK